MILDIVEMAGDRPLEPRSNQFSVQFWDGLNEGVFRTTRCNSCEHITFPPKQHCPECGGTEVLWMSLEGGGALYAKTTIHAAPSYFADDVPYTVAIVDLDEGVRLVTRLLDDEASLDSRVQLVVARYQDGCLFAVRPLV